MTRPTSKQGVFVMHQENRNLPLFTPRTQPLPVEQTLACDERACPYCAETVKAAAVKCRHCGEHFGTPTGGLNSNQPAQVVVNNVITNTVGGSPTYLKSRWTAALLALFLGGFGVHKFYVGRSGWGLLYFLFSWTLVPAGIALLEALSYLSFRNDEDFTRRACF